MQHKLQIKPRHKRVIVAKNNLWLQSAVQAHTGSAIVSNDDFQLHSLSVQNLLAGLGKIHGDPVSDARLDLSRPPLGRPGVTDAHTRFKHLVHNKLSCFNANGNGS